MICMVSLETTSVIIFFSIVAILLLRYRKKVKFSYGMITIEWEKGKELIDKFAKKRKRLVHYIGIAGIVLGTLASFVACIFW